MGYQRRVHGIIRLFFILILIILQIIIISFHPILFNLMLILIRLIISFFVLKINIFSKINSSNFFPIMVYENINIFLITFLILYLLFTLICVVKLVKFEYGPLVKRL